MRISVSGSAGCGKTTLVVAIAARFDLPIIDENFDDVILQGNEPEQFLDLILATLERKSAQEEELLSFVSDRGPIDLLHLSLNRRLHRQHRDRVVNLIQQCVKSARTYDLVVFPAWRSVPLVQSEEGRLQRNPDPIAQMMFHAHMLGEAHIWLDKRRLLLLPQGMEEVEERVDFIEQVLRNRFPQLL